MNKGKLILFLILAVQCLCAQKQYQLAPPIATFESVFFQKKMALAFKFEQPGTLIRYTTDGGEPNDASQPYRQPLVISKHLTIIKAKSFGDGLIPSETLTVQFFSTGHKIATLNTSAPNPKYTGNGAYALKDNKSSGTNHNDPAWLGFDGDSVIIDLSLEKYSDVSRLLLHILNNQGAWIFLPEKIDVYQVDGNNPVLVSSKSFETMKEPGTEVQALMVDFPVTRAKEFRIVVFPVKSIPPWHPGKGNKGWFFMDEIKLY